MTRGLEVKVSITDYKEFMDFIEAVNAAMKDAPEPVKEKVLEAYNKLKAVRQRQEEEQDAQEC